MIGRFIVPSRRCLAALCLLLLMHPAAAEAQGARRVAIDTVTGVQDFFREARDWPTQVVLDTFVSAEPYPGFEVSLRPKLWRVNGDWKPLLDQASIQYEFRKGSNWRIEAGRFPSIIGLGMIENRPDLNAGVIWWHRPYYMPVPSLGVDMPRVSLISTVYPVGVAVSTSGDHWDARGSLVDRSPVEFWTGDALASRSPNLILGAGVSPRQGLRFGVAGAAGTLAPAAAAHPGSRYRMLNVEADYAFGYARVSGEWTRDRFETPGGVRIVKGLTAQVQYTLTPRLFLHSRATTIQAPDAGASVVIDRTYRAVDTTLGYRLDADLTARVAYTAARSFGATQTDHQIGMSLIWAKRWW